MHSMKTSLCRVSGNPLTKVIDFGRQPLGNGFLNQDDFKNEYFYQMEVGFCETSMMFQLIEQPDPDRMFHENYAFFSRQSKKMQEHFKKYADWVFENYLFVFVNYFLI